MLRRVCGKFAYRSNDPTEATLHSDSSMIGEYMKKLLQIRMDIAGVEIQRMAIMDIAYDPGMSAALL